MARYQVVQGAAGLADMMAALHQVPRGIRTSQGVVTVQGLDWTITLAGDGLSHQAVGGVWSVSGIIRAMTYRQGTDAFAVDGLSLRGETLMRGLDLGSAADPRPALNLIRGADLRASGTSGDDSLILLGRHGHLSNPPSLLFDLTRVGDQTLSGGAGHDLLRGARGDDRLLGGTGDDILHLSGGTDRLYGGAGDDAIRPGGGVTAGTTHAFGGAGHDTLLAGAGHDRLSGGGGDDSLAGNGGDDVLRGGSGADRLAAGAGNDSLFGDGGHDSLRGDEGNDGMDAGLGNDGLFGGLGNDSLTGGVGDDLLDGGAGWNDLFGGAGNDRLVAKSGDAAMDGGTGADLFIFATPIATGRADIFGFDAAAGDRLSLDRSAGGWSFSQVEGSVFLTLNSSSAFVLELHGVDEADLYSYDPFVFT